MEGHSKAKQRALQGGRNKLGHVGGRKGSHIAGTERAKKNVIDKIGEEGQLT